MCYSGKCIYEDGMGDCIAPDGLKNSCYKGHKYSRKENRKIHKCKENKRLGENYEKHRTRIIENCNRKCK